MADDWDGSDLDWKDLQDLPYYVDPGYIHRPVHLHGTVTGRIPANMSAIEDVFPKGWHYDAHNTIYMGNEKVPYDQIVCHMPIWAWKARGERICALTELAESHLRNIPGFLAGVYNTAQSSRARNACARKIDYINDMIAKIDKGEIVMGNTNTNTNNAINFLKEGTNILNVKRLYAAPTTRMTVDLGTVQLLTRDESIKKGDIVVFWEKSGEMVNLGEVTSLQEGYSNLSLQFAIQKVDLEAHKAREAARQELATMKRTLDKKLADINEAKQYELLLGSDDEAKELIKRMAEIKAMLGG